MNQNQDFVAQGLARWYRGRLIPIMKGASEDEDVPLFAPVPDDLSALSVEELQTFADGYAKAIADVGSDPSQFVTAEFTADMLYAEARAAVATLRALKAELASRPVESALSELERTAFENLAAEAAEEPEGGNGEGEPEPEGEPEGEAAAEATVAEPEGEAATAEPAGEAVTAAAQTGQLKKLPRPGASREIVEQPSGADKPVALTAAAGAPNYTPGDGFGSDLEIAAAMIERHSKFGASGPGTTEQYTIAKAIWKDDYPVDRRLGQDIESNWDAVKAVTAPAQILREFESRRQKQINGAPDSLVASGGLCAPVTPYYNLQYISVPERPVMGALPSFNADRGGLRYATPAALSAVTTGVGLITAEEDEAGGSSATKSCQVIACPEFQETDVDIIYHCLQFGNLGARTFPELVAQWNNLVLAAHARLAESNLLTGIDAFSTQVTAGSLGLGASASFFSQLLTAADGMRSRNRMSPNAVLRALIPWWAPDLIVSDIIRTQFQRFDTDRARVVALLRSFNIEPSFYIDSANGRGQVYGTQSDGALLAFPDTTVTYLFPEGSFLYLDGGQLELGIVRDSVLNQTNDFQIFGETFENVAFVGVESLAIESIICDSGAVSAPETAPACPIEYSIS